MDSAPQRKHTSVWQLSAVLWILVLAIMASFQTWRGAYVDGALFYALVLVLIVDRLTRGRIVLIRRPIIAPPTLIVAITGVLAVVLVLAPRHSWIDFLAISAIGLTVVLVAWAPRPEPPPVKAAPLRRSVIAWSVLAVAMCVVEAVTFVLSVTMPQGSDGFPTISVLLDPIVSNIVGRALVVALWLAAGLALLGLWRKR